MDGTRAYVHAVIDNFSRRILAFRVGERFEIGNAIAVLVEAAQKAVGVNSGGDPPMLVVDGGVENFNGQVDELIDHILLRDFDSDATTERFMTGLVTISVDSQDVLTHLADHYGLVTTLSGETR